MGRLALLAALTLMMPITESFETGFGGWEPDTDGRAPAWSVTRSTDQAYDGKYSLKVFMDGRQDDGTTWVERQFAIARGETVTVTVTFRLWSEVQARVGGWAVVAVASPRNPEAEADFDRLGNTEELKGWKAYSRSWTVTADNWGRVWVAFGTSVLWEVQKLHYLDLVEVTIVPTKG